LHCSLHGEPLRSAGVQDVQLPTDAILHRHLGKFRWICDTPLERGKLH
jgi:hypothetical protein